MRDRYAVWENETTHTFYIEALPNTVQPGKRLLYSGKEYLNFKNKDHAELLVNMLNGLVDEAGILEQRVHYWKIEAETDHGRWLRCLEDLERLRASSFVTAVPVEEYEKLKAEVERLTDQVSYDNRTQLYVDKLAAEFTQYEVEKLKVEVERLRKAGDWMCDLLRFDFVTKEWNAAKEGKQS